MGSSARAQFEIQVRKAAYLYALVRDKRLTPTRDAQRQVLLHGGLAALVAAWEAYVEALVSEFFDATSTPADVRFSALHGTLREYARRSADKLNTPNWENVRNLLVTTTGFDPMPSWSWQRASRLSVQSKLNEVLRVRHAFAHGFQIPPLSWTQSTRGRTRLTFASLRGVEKFLQRLVERTDRGMQRFIQINFRVRLAWY